MYGIYRFYICQGGKWFESAPSTGGSRSTRRRGTTTCGCCSGRCGTRCQEHGLPDDFVSLGTLDVAHGCKGQRCTRVVRYGSTSVPNTARTAAALPDALVGLCISPAYRAPILDKQAAFEYTSDRHSSLRPMKVVNQERGVAAVLGRTTQRRA